MKKILLFVPLLCSCHTEKAVVPAAQIVVLDGHAYEYQSKNDTLLMTLVTCIAE